jgi:hypothetical protein
MRFAHRLVLAAALFALSAIIIPIGEARAQADFQAFLKKIDGSTYICPEETDADSREAAWFKIRSGDATYWKQTLWLSESFMRVNHNFTVGQKYPASTIRLTNWRSPGWVGGGTIDISDSKMTVTVGSSSFNCIRE